MNNSCHENKKLNRNLQNYALGLTTDTTNVPSDVNSDSTIAPDGKRFERIYPNSWYHKNAPTINNLVNVVQNRKLRDSQAKYQTARRQIMTAGKSFNNSLINSNRKNLVS